MPTFYPTLPRTLATWTQSQPLFFISTAPTHSPHISISPKGLPSLAFLQLAPTTTVAYIDQSGSGAETISHLYENGRATIMFCSFGEKPRILRLYCRVKSVVERGDCGFEDTLSHVSRMRGRNWEAETKDGEGSAGDGGGDTKITSTTQRGDTNHDQNKNEEVNPYIFPGAPAPVPRAVITFHVFSVQTSCGYGVPQLRPELYDPSYHSPTESNTRGRDYVLPPAEKTDTPQPKPSELSLFLHRQTLASFWLRTAMVPGKVESYTAAHNARSLDGLPGMRHARRAAGERFLLVGDMVWRLRRVLEGEKLGVLLGFFVALVVGWGVVSGGILAVEVRGFGGWVGDTHIH